MAGNPIGWFLREVFDRYRDRPFWLSQQALRAAKERPMSCSISSIPPSAAATPATCRPR
jgi:hypothetical protein